MIRVRGSYSGWLRLPSWPYTQWRRSVAAASTQGSHASSVGHICSDDTLCALSAVDLGRCPMWLLRVSGSYPGWVRLVKLAIHAVETVDTSCGDAGIACQQLGAH